MLALVALVLTFGGCAGLKATHVGSAGSEPDKEARGFRFYEQAPFLLIHSDGQGGLTSTIAWLPDTRRVISARPYAWLANGDVTLEFNNGTLSKATATIDETVVATKSFDALAKVLAAAAMNAVPAVREGKIPTPYLFRIVSAGSGITLLGGPAQDESGQEIEIAVTLPEPMP